MFVTTAITGCKCRKEASDSSASTTMKSPPPSRACEPAAVRRPPITKVGSSPPSASTLATRLVVVVLPCVPAMATPCFRRISSASMRARGTTGMRRDHLRVVRPHCGGHDDCIGAVHIRRQMLEAQPHAERREPFGGGIDGEVRAADLIAEVDQDFGDARHACAADAHEMDPPDLVLHLASSMQRAATSRA